MEATVVVPVKRFGAAKSRLADALDPDARGTLAAAMLADVLAALGRCEQVERVLVVSGEHRARMAAIGAGAGLLDDPDDESHSLAAIRGVHAAMHAGASAAALLPGDCPLLVAAELDAELLELEAGSALVVPDRHGSGTNGLLLAPPDAIAPAFGPGSRDRHLALAREAGVIGGVAEIPSLALDLDTPEDLDELGSLLGADADRAPATAAALVELGGPGEGK